MSKQRVLYCCAVCDTEAVVAEGPVAVCARCAAGHQRPTADQARRAHARTLAMSLPDDAFFAAGLNRRTTEVLRRMAARGMSERSMADGLNVSGFWGPSEDSWAPDDVARILSFVTKDFIPPDHSGDAVVGEPESSPAEALRSLLVSRRDSQWFDIVVDQVTLSGSVTYRDGYADPLLRLSNGEEALCMPVGETNKLLPLLDTAATRAMKWMTGTATPEDEEPITEERLRLGVEGKGFQVFRLEILPDSEVGVGVGSVSFPMESIPELRRYLAAGPEGVHLQVTPRPEASSAPTLEDESRTRASRGSVQTDASQARGADAAAASRELPREDLLPSYSPVQAPERGPLGRKKPGWMSKRGFWIGYIVSVGIVLMASSMGVRRALHELDVITILLIAGPFWGAVVGLLVGLVRRASWKA